MAARRVRVGVQIAQHGADWQALRSAAVEAEALGVDAVFNWDHFFGPGPDSSATHLECWMILAAWAEATERITIGQLVSAIGYRNPDLLADMARTVDRISGGRVLLGLGAGFKQRDHDDYDYPFPSLGRRLSALDDGVARIRARLERSDPRPGGRLPILIGGSGEQRTLRIVARSADAWHTFADGDAFEHKSHVLDGYCHEIGRDPAEIERSVLVAGDPTNVARHSGASTAAVRIDVTERELRLEVTDVGSAADWIPGVGITSMIERARQIGGDLRATSTPSGGRVVARIPLDG